MLCFVIRDIIVTGLKLLHIFKAVILNKLLKCSFMLPCVSLRSSAQSPFLYLLFYFVFAAVGNTQSETATTENKGSVNYNGCLVFENSQRFGVKCGILSLSLSPALRV